MQWHAHRSMWDQAATGAAHLAGGVKLVQISLSDPPPCGRAAPVGARPKVVRWTFHCMCHLWTSCGACRDTHIPIPAHLHPFHVG